MAEVFGPLDAHDESLLKEVRPADWQNPPGGSYDAVIIGGGSAGLVCASICAGLGARTALVEKGLLGGDCLNTGCVPSKGLLHAARQVATARRAHWKDDDGPGLPDAQAALEQMRRLRAKIAPHDSAAGLRAKGVDVYFGSARFAGESRFAVGEALLDFRRAFLASGARPVVPRIPGLEQPTVYTSDSFFTLEDLPRRLLVLGGGPIGCELAQAAARLGSTVCLVEAGDRLLPRDEEEAAGILQRQLRADGVELRLACTLRAWITGEEGCRAELEQAGETDSWRADGLLLAVGRRPNTEALDCPAGAVELGQRGEILVDARMRSSNRRVYAIGDVVGGPQFTHAGDAMARAVVRNAFFGGRVDHRRLPIPWCTYTQPEAAGIGAGLGELRRRDRKAGEIRIPFDGLDRAILDRGQGYLKVIHDGKGRVRGLRIVADHAGELLAAAALLVSRKEKLSRLSGLVLPYPTLGEAFRRAGDQWMRARLKPGIARLLRAWIRRG